MSDHRTVIALIRGRVQGVSYRVWTREKARTLGLAGHVRNRADGSVEALFSGPAEAVERMLAACRQGPPGARVEDVAIREATERPPSHGFVILRD